MSTVPAAVSGSVSSQFTHMSSTYFPTPFHLQQAYVSPAVPLVPATVVPFAPAAPTTYPVAAAATSAGGVNAPPQYQQAQQLFQKDAQIITPEALEGVKAALASSETAQKAETKKKAVPRKAAGQSWEDPTLADWPETMLLQAFFFNGNLSDA